MEETTLDIAVVWDHLNLIKNIFSTEQIASCIGVEHDWKNIVVGNEQKGDVFILIRYEENDSWKIEFVVDVAHYLIYSEEGSCGVILVRYGCIPESERDVIEAFMSFARQILVLDKMGKFPKTI